MMIETSLINIIDAINNGRTLSKGQQVTLPVEGDATIYGFLAIENFIFSSMAIDMPPLGEATVLSNRVIFAFDKKLHRFPIFNSVCKVTEEKYGLQFLYVPRLLNLSKQWIVNAYEQSMVQEKPNPTVARIDGVKIEDNVAYYYPHNDDMYFKSSSKLRGLGDGLAVIIRRISKISGDIKYEIYNPEEIQVENL